MSKKTDAFNHKDNPCRNAGTGECKVEFPDNPTMEDIQQNHFAAKCGSCAKPEQIYDTKYRACLGKYFLFQNMLFNFESNATILFL